uniref:Ataxin 7-like 2a n=1 Tax=Neogobius melanostomus TaxID=47308 RepID=A0A8C6UTY2_9GOBI
MAALVRRVPSLDDFVGQSWSSWVEWAGVTAVDGRGIDDHNRNDKKAAEAMPLSKEDMSIFGLFPGHDDFFLVVCNHCGHVVKPQAFEKHCERRHGPLAKLYAKLRTVNPVHQPSKPTHNQPLSHATSTLPVSSWDSKGQAAGNTRNTPPSPATPPQYRLSKSPKEAARHSPLEKSSYSGCSEPKVFKAPPPLEHQMRSQSPSLRDPLGHMEGAYPYDPQPVTGPPPQKGDATELSSTSPSHSKKRECDLDKHCGVLDHDRKKVCTRLLTCNIHSVHHRRKVLGRSKNFDELVAELKTKAREKGLQNTEGGLCVKRSPSPEAPIEQASSPHCRRPLANLPAFRWVNFENHAVEETPEGDSPRPLSPAITGRFSSDDSDGELPEEPAEYHSSAAHPRPLAMCSFGSHGVGPGIFMFDRRLHHLRSALSNMIEQHISAHLWRKIPQVTQFPASANTWTSSSLLHSKLHTESHIGSPLKTQRNSLSSHGPKVTPSHSASSGVNSGLADVNFAVKHVRPKSSKQMLKLREEVANAAAMRKRKAPSQDGEHSGPSRNCTPLQDQHSHSTPIASNCASKSPLPSPLPYGQTNGTLSPSSKPRPQPSSTESQWTHRRTRPPPLTSPQNSTPIDHTQGCDLNTYNAIFVVGNQRMDLDEDLTYLKITFGCL